MDGPTDGWTNGWTDTCSYRVTSSQLKMIMPSRAAKVYKTDCIRNIFVVGDLRQRGCPINLFSFIIEKSHIDIASSLCNFWLLVVGKITNEAHNFHISMLDDPLCKAVVQLYSKLKSVASFIALVKRNSRI